MLAVIILDHDILHLKDHFLERSVLIEGESGIKSLFGGVVTIVGNPVMQVNGGKVGITFARICPGYRLCQLQRRCGQLCRQFAAIGLARLLDAYQGFVGEVFGFAEVGLIASRMGVQQIVAVEFAIPSPVDVEVVATLIAVAHELMLIAPHDDGAPF